MPENAVSATNNAVSHGKIGDAFLAAERAEARLAAGDLLAPDTSMDAVTLKVGDLPAMASYYSDALALAPVAESEGRVVLGRADTPLVVLEAASGLPAARRNQAGLFHTALLFGDDSSLAATVLLAAQDSRSRFVGSADHLVSNAFYFVDPEGNGIELYADKDRSLWPFRDGQIQMPSLALDPNAFLEENLGTETAHATPQIGAEVGHVHLQVGELAPAREFYVDTLGFEVTFEYSGALFVSAGGYHHHLAMNTWNSKGAGPRAATLGLGSVAISVPQRSGLDAVAERLRHRGIAFGDDGNTLTTLDPWNTAVTLSVEGAQA